MNDIVLIKEIMRCIEKKCPDGWCYCERYNLMRIRDHLETGSKTEQVHTITNHSLTEIASRDPADCASGG